VEPTAARAGPPGGTTATLDGLLAHHAEAVVVHSPAAARLWPDSAGLLRGKPTLREFWTEGLRLVPDLRFEVLAVFAGADTIVINQRDQTGRLAAEVFTLRGGLTVRAVGAIA
jgi:hypothetical protein